MLTPQQITTLLVRHWTTLLWAGVIGVVLGVGLSVLRPLEFRSSIRLLITQESVSSDAYTASRSAERVADDLSNIV